ncbi:Hypothetical protein PFR_JS9-2_2041 [Propionibacterium freudenreichii]|nr:Hypothetical protein PFR_JS9-1_2043 [Propionibacterium freudenreichii]SCQ70632.1 Hypothetical protein PFR_JS9-2_2041 [Propionibacterium freudenreichii]
MRGALINVAVAESPLGLTPAYAGSTVRPPQMPVSGRAHPRICGEHGLGEQLRPVLVGSPPHMRGAQAGRGCQSVPLGLTPAYAGSTPSAPTHASWNWAHPRICGEHQRAWPAPSHQGGSPPHMRGARDRKSPGEKPLGLTPAYAGSTRKVTRSRIGWRAHPRICGEHSPRRARSTPFEGSPPHMRGALESQGITLQGLGLTPAYAGSTLHYR